VERRGRVQRRDATGVPYPAETGVAASSSTKGTEGLGTPLGFRRSWTFSSGGRRQVVDASDPDSGPSSPFAVRHLTTSLEVHSAHGNGLALHGTPGSQSLVARRRSTMTRPSSNRRASAGYSLIECLLAAGLLTGVLVSISGLFILGSTNVKSGRELTKATTIGNSVMEQVESWPYAQVYGFAGGIDSDQTKTWSTNSVNPTYVADANDAAAWAVIANQWRTDVRAQLLKGELIYKVDGMGRLPTASDAGRVVYSDAQFLRVTVTIKWTERNGRQRQVVFEEMTL